MKTNFDLQEAIQIALSSKRVIRLTLIQEQDNIHLENEQMQKNDTTFDEQISSDNACNDESNVEGKNQNETELNDANEPKNVPKEDSDTSTENNVDTSDPLKNFMYNLGKVSLQNIEETLEQSQKAVENILDSLFGPSPNKREFRHPENKRNRFKREYEDANCLKTNNMDSEDKNMSNEKETKPIEEKESILENYEYKGKYTNEFEQLKQMGFPLELSADILESCKGDIVETIDTLAKMKI